MLRGKPKSKYCPASSAVLRPGVVFVVTSLCVRHLTKTPIDKMTFSKCKLLIYAVGFRATPSHKLCVKRCTRLKKSSSSRGEDF
ncbi:hypothetical protein CEXT_756581 [Caerostris extrusa]|uniref:Uncharacterized protein n=1 Tax=Caerostris extrusa TaxID=172846 RepID=A0AAV4UGH3_CAEEX|nr:hypothetical protein CEXT_756581 [Caerostris extrusa]